MKLLPILFAFIFSSIQISASNTIEVRTQISKMDCSVGSSTVYMDILIRKAANIAEDIYLEHQNYRFNFDAQSLQQGSFFIESEGELLSGSNIFGAHHLTGTNNNTISYNIEFEGNAQGFPLEEKWIHVGTIGATLLTNNECITPDVLTAATHPATTLVYKDSALASSQSIIDQEPVINTITSCIESNCQLCSDKLLLLQSQNNYVSGENFEHQVGDYIEAENIIGQQADVIYNVKNFGMLNDGFEVESNAKFELKIGGCQN